MAAEIRKHQHTLLITGNAVILFGIWDIVKMILNLTLNQSVLELVQYQAADLPPEIQELAVVLSYIAIAITTLFSILVRVYVGRTAIRLGRGENRKCRGMVFWSVIFLVFSVIGAPASLFGIFTGEDILNMAGTFIFDLTSIITLAGMLTALAGLKKLTKQASQYGVNNAA